MIDNWFRSMSVNSRCWLWIRQRRKKKVVSEKKKKGLFLKKVLSDFGVG